VHLVSQRFGVQPFLHPAIKGEPLAFEPPMVLLELIDGYLFGQNRRVIEMTAAEIQRDLTCDTSDCRFEDNSICRGIGAFTELSTFFRSEWFNSNFV